MPLIMVMRMPNRDRTAGVKLLGGLLRLDGLQPAGFTAQELAKYAGVNRETARDFIRDSSYTEVVSREQHGKLASGRPEKVYRLLPEGRAEIIGRLAEVRRAAGPVAPTSEVADELFAPLRLLADLLDELEQSVPYDEEWESCFKEAKLELQGAEADLRALQAQGSNHAEEFARKFSALRGRLLAIEQSGPAPSRSTLDWVGWLVEQFGSWLEDATALRNAAVKLDRAIVLFDGVAGRNDPLVSRLLHAYRDQDVPVAVFDVVGMGEAKRTDLFAGFGALRLATPLAVCNLVLAVDGRTKTGRMLAAEFGKLDHPGEWDNPSGLDDQDLSSLRRFYLNSVMRTLNTAAEPSVGWAEAFHTATASRLVSVLSACYAAETVAGREDNRPFFGAEPASERWQNMAAGLLGPTVCFDAERNAEIEATLAEGSVEYRVGTEAETWFAAEPRRLTGD